MRIGIDVGGTNTDAVLLDGHGADVRVLAANKSATSEDVTAGIIDTLDRLQAERSFDPAAALRLGLPATASLPPLVDWPERLVEAISGRSYLAHGGHEFDGRHIAELDEDELRRHATDMAAHGVRSVAVSSVFSPVSNEFELRAAE